MTFPTFDSGDRMLDLDGQILRFDGAVSEGADPQVVDLGRVHPADVG